MGVQVTVWPRGKRRTKTSGPLGISWTKFGGSAESRRVGTPIFATDTGKLTAVTASTTYGDGIGGHDLASWTVQPLGGYVGGMFRPGDHVRVTKGGGTVFEGEYSEAEPNGDGTVTMHARGYRYNLYEYDSIYWDQLSGADDVYYPTTKLGDPADTAEPFYGWGYAVQSLGLPINQVVGDTSDWLNPFGATVMAPAPTKLAPLIDGIALQNGERANVWGRTLVIAADDMTPVWSYAAPEVVFGVADTDYRTHIFVWYCANGPAAWDNTTAYAVGTVVVYDDRWWRALVANTGVTPVEGSTWQEQPIVYRPSDFSMERATDTVGLARFDVATEVVDYRGLGKITSTKAGQLATNLLSQVKGRFTLAGSFSVGPDSGLTSAAGGGQADVAFVRAGQAIALPGVRTGQGNLMPDGDTYMIGKTEWSWSTDGQEATTITPMGAVARNLSAILAGRPIDPASVISGKRPAA